MRDEAKLRSISILPCSFRLNPGEGGGEGSWFWPVTCAGCTAAPILSGLRYCASQLSALPGRGRIWTSGHLAG
jgi:hypothetical protein